MTIKERMAAIERYEVNEETQKFADHCLQKCVEWFGAPDDLATPYEFWTYTRTSCSRSFLDKTYNITFAPEDRCEVSPERHWLFLAHEMYHRCTMKRNGMRKYVWADEMLAYATSYHICEKTVQSQPIDKIIESCLADQPAVDWHRWMRLKRWRVRWGSYPKGFSSWVIQLAEALHYVITWEQLRNLAFAKNLPVWLNSLPTMERDFVEVLLKQKEPDLIHLASYDSPDDITGFGYALIVMHEYETAFALYARLEEHNRFQPKEYKYLVQLLMNRGLYDKAVYCLQKAFDLGMQDEDTRINLVFALIWAKRYDAALPHIEYILAQENSKYKEKAKEYFDIVSKNS